MLNMFQFFVKLINSWKTGITFAINQCVDALFGRCGSFNVILVSEVLKQAVSRVASLCLFLNHIVLSSVPHFMPLLFMSSSVCFTAVHLKQQ